MKLSITVIVADANTHNKTKQYKNKKTKQHQQKSDQLQLLFSTKTSTPSVGLMRRTICGRRILTEKSFQFNTDDCEEKSTLLIAAR